MKFNLLNFALVVFAFVLLLITNPIKANSDYEKILKCDKDDIYTTIYDIYLQNNEKQFDKLVNKILSKENNNLLSIAFISKFVIDNDINCKFRNVMSLKLEQLEKLPLDSQWRCPVSGKMVASHKVCK